MWVLTIRCPVDRKVAEEVAEFARRRGCSVQIEQVNSAFVEVDLTNYLIQVNPDQDRHKDGVLIKSEPMRKKGFITLNDLTKISFEVFLRQALWGQEHLLGLMVLHGATFTDADPGQFKTIIQPDSDLTVYTRNCLDREGVKKWEMLPYISARFLLGIDHVATTRLDEIKQCLKRRGLRLKGE